MDSSQKIRRWVAAEFIFLLSAAWLGAGVLGVAAGGNPLILLLGLAGLPVGGGLAFY